MAKPNQKPQWISVANALDFVLFLLLFLAGSISGHYLDVDAYSSRWDDPDWKITSKRGMRLVVVGSALAVGTSILALYFRRFGIVPATSIFIGVIFAMAGVGAVLESGRQRRGYPLVPTLCPKCRYDLTGNVSGVCPECGTKIVV